MGKIFEINAEYEQFESWHPFMFIIHEATNYSPLSKDECGRYQILNYKQTKNGISFYKHYTEGMVLFLDSNRVIKDEYTCYYELKKSKNGFEGIWVNEFMIESGLGPLEMNSGKAKLFIIEKNG